MSESLWIVGASTPSMALRYAAAFFLVVVGIGLIYALVRLGGTLRSAEKLMTDVDTEVVPLLKQATETLDGVNTELDKVDVVMSSVVDATEKVDQTTRLVESAITVPPRRQPRSAPACRRPSRASSIAAPTHPSPSPARARRAAPRGVRRPVSVTARPCRRRSRQGRRPPRRQDLPPAQCLPPKRPPRRPTSRRPTGPTQPRHPRSPSHRPPSRRPA